MSKHVVHEPLVSEAEFFRAQAIDARPEAGAAGCIYLLVGLLVCGCCGRRMESHWVHDRAGYRCRRGRAGVGAAGGERVRSLYIREDHIVREL